jgi:hypothetical protein
MSKCKYCGNRIDSLIVRSPGICISRMYVLGSDILNDMVDFKETAAPTFHCRFCGEILTTSYDEAEHLLGGEKDAEMS